MYKLPEVKARAISQETLPGTAAARKRIRRAPGLKDSGKRSRLIFKPKKSAERLNMLPATRNALNPIVVNNLNNIYNIYGNNALVPSQLYCPEGACWLEKNNKSFDDATKKTLKRRKRRRAKTATRLRVDQPSMLLNCGGKKRLLKTLIEKENCRHTANPLFKHEIQSRQRSRMADWMIECFSIFDKSDEAFFLSVYTLDDFLDKTDNIYQDDDVHLLGLSSIFVASKYADVYPICLEDVTEKLGHCSFGPKVIKKHEVSMMLAFEWDLDMVTPIHFIDHIMVMLKIGIKSPGFSGIFYALEKAAIQNCRIAVVDPKMLEFKPSELAIAGFSLGCDLLFDLQAVGHKTRMQQVYGFFQDLLSQDVLNRDRCLEAIERLKALKASFKDEFPYCLNVDKFTLINEDISM